MTTPSKGPRPQMQMDEYGYGSFFVTVEAVVGEVSLDPNADTPAHTAAFVLIAERNEPGTYKFPMRDGGTCVVEVAYVAPEGWDPR